MIFMPWGDRTGPEGFGPRTGRGLGYCSGYDRPGYMNDYAAGRGMGRGYGRGAGFGRGAYGRGFGRGYGNGRRVNDYVNPPVNTSYNNETEAEYLKNTADALEKELQEVRKRLNEISDNDNE